LPGSWRGAETFVASLCTGERQRLDDADLVLRGSFDDVRPHQRQVGSHLHPLGAAPCRLFAEPQSRVSADGPSRALARLTRTGRRAADIPASTATSFRLPPLKRHGEH